MIDLNSFLQCLEHKISAEGASEKSDYQAIKIDDTDGLAIFLGFHDAMLPKVDYYSYLEHQIQLIELTDLEDSIAQCQLTMNEEKERAKKEKGENLNRKEHKTIEKKVWMSVIFEFKGKWCGSIAVIERLYRKNEVHESDPEYQLLIVCKNITDSRMLDELDNTLCKYLDGMMKKVLVCNTENLEKFLIAPMD